MRFPVKLFAAATITGAAVTVAGSPTLFRNLLDTKKSDALKLDGCKRFSSFHHPHSKYVSEVIKSLNCNLFLVFNNDCGAIDCINEACCESDIPTIVINCKERNIDNGMISGSVLKDGVLDYIQNLPLDSMYSRVLNRVSSLLDPKHDSYRSYIEKLSNEELFQFFFSILDKYPTKEFSIKGSEESLQRSAVVILKTTLASIEGEMERLQIMSQVYPSVLFILSVDSSMIEKSDNPDLSSLPLLALAPLNHDEIDEVFPEESFEREALTFADGYWEEAMELIQDHSIHTEDDVLVISERRTRETVKNLKDLLLSTTIDPLSRLFALGFCSGVITNDLLSSPKELINVDNQDKLSSISYSDVKHYFETHFYLPEYFVDTTFGPVAIADSIRSGSSRILHTIMAQPDVQESLQVFNNNACNVEEIAKKNDIDNLQDLRMLHSDVTYKESSLRWLDTHYHLKLKLQHPAFSLSGWSELSSQLFYHPDRILQRAYEEMINEVGEELIREEFKRDHDLIFKRRQLYLQYFSLNQLYWEAKTIMLFINEFSNYFTDDYTVTDWIQGLIDIVNLSTSFLLHKEQLNRENKKTVSLASSYYTNLNDELKDLDSYFENVILPSRQRLFAMYREELKKRKDSNEVSSEDIAEDWW